ncbi:hypothetical protein AB0A63_19770 [Lentzea sp. NPDC042327]|uniref:hypothetical protein n=1 Tax=Lentzea sp. NPDC042327 TaxID=3154801 RepID=UPI0033DAB0C7
MTRTGQIGRQTGAAADFTEARLAADETGVVRQRQAARLVAQHCHDAQDCRDLLAMLGLSELAPRTAGPTRDEQKTTTSPEALGVHRTTEGARR